MTVEREQAVPDAPAAAQVSPAHSTAAGLTPPAANDADARLRRRRTLGFAILGALVLLGALGYGSYWWLIASRYVSTDDAYVEATAAQITPQVAASVVRVPVRNTQYVTAGTVLVILDNADARIAVERAQAQLEAAERAVRGDFAGVRQFTAQVAARRAQIAAARSNLAKARLDLARREKLAATGAISAEDLTGAENAYRNAVAALAAAQAQLRQAQQARAAQDALVSGASVQTNPRVLAARAELHRAQLNLARTVIRAPIAGIVTNDTAQVGQRVAVGAVLMSVVPIYHAYVNANFKETELARVRIGDPVTLQSDLYGDAVVYHGRVAGLAGGTGAAFALIPAQNATGNWIKVVQRLPVRIEIDPQQLRQHPLRVGLSMTATINTTSHD
jgi:membrane fusion protein (multidrug efflux system)